MCISISPEGSVGKVLFCFQFSTGSSFWLHLISLLKLAGNQKCSYMTSYLWHSSMAWSFAETNPPDNKSKIEISLQSVITREGCMAHFLLLLFHFEKKDTFFWTVTVIWIAAYISKHRGWSYRVCALGMGACPVPLCCCRDSKSTCSPTAVPLLWPGSADIWQNCVYEDWALFQLHWKILKLCW